ncbi:hypothetical protein ACJ73_06189 [Blastomyces percursus]|uniref:Uncharacterized protein n=1 Tax=Blastomyces percursus TaxID=1658174 RepID=A0A1J9Q1Q8_9EURO|nr:hypothetical protein ACJ73_06189 [Blastomyces percursus]
MAGVATPPTKKRCLEDDDEDPSSSLGSQPIKSKRRVASTSCSSTSDSSSCESSYDSDSCRDQGDDAPVPRPLTHRYRAPMQQLDDDETSSSCESESSMSSSSSSPSSSSGSESESESNLPPAASSASDIVSIPHGRPHFKPSIRRFNTTTLRNRLASFLPKLRATNENLEQEIAAGNVAGVELDHSDETKVEGQYIEMNLGLGVLEGQTDDAASDTSTGSGSAIARDEDESTKSASASQPKPLNNTNVMNKLMGKKPEMKRPTIEEIAP